MEGYNYYYKRESQLIEKISGFNLNLLSSRALRKDFTGECPLCHANDVEVIIKKFDEGFVCFNKYPVVERSFLYITHKHSNVLNGMILNDLRKLLLEQDLYIFSNMNNKCSVPDHLHFEIIESNYIPIKVKKSLSKLEGYTGNNVYDHYWIPFIYFRIDDHTSLNEFKILFELLIKRGRFFNLIFFSKYLIVQLIKSSLDEVDTSARTFCGIYSTSNMNKFREMKEVGLLNILKKYSYNKTHLNKLLFELV